MKSVVGIVLLHMAGVLYLLYAVFASGCTIERVVLVGDVAPGRAALDRGNVDLRHAEPLRDFMGGVW